MFNAKARRRKGAKAQRFLMFNAKAQRREGFYRTLHLCVFALNRMPLRLNLPLGSHLAERETTQ